VDSGTKEPNFSWSSLRRVLINDGVTGESLACTSGDGCELCVLGFCIGDRNETGMSSSPYEGRVLIEGRVKSRSILALTISEAYSLIFIEPLLEKNEDWLPRKELFSLSDDSEDKLPVLEGLGMGDIVF